MSFKKSRKKLNIRSIYYGSTPLFNFNPFAKEVNQDPLLLVDFNEHTLKSLYTLFIKEKLDLKEDNFSKLSEKAWDIDQVMLFIYFYGTEDSNIKRVVDILFRSDFFSAYETVLTKFHKKYGRSSKYYNLYWLVKNRVRTIKNVFYGKRSLDEDY